MICNNFSQWRNLAREAIASRTPPERMRWGSEPELFAEPQLLPAVTKAFTCPGEFLKIAQTVSYHRSEEKWDLLYQVLWEIVHGRRRILEDHADARVHRLNILAKQVKRDIHKMTAFVRFEKIRDEPETFVAWHEPDHFIIKAAAPFFAKRFGAMNWAILTPDGGAVWNQKALSWIDGPLQKITVDHDVSEDLWKIYFSNIFNPARLKVNMMKREMPVRYWKNLPEAQLIPGLIAGAAKRMQDMILSSQIEMAASAPRAASQSGDSIDELRAGVRVCQACDLCKPGNAGVPSIGPITSPVMLVGEQPGDQEDLEGRPFVGPAGALLHEILSELKIPSEAIYMTNAVKHFRFKRQGKLRLHLRPSASHTQACRPWLSRELAMVRPKIILCLGATATHSVLGYALPVHQARGRSDLVSEEGAKVHVTLHPSAVLRADPELAAQMRAQLRSDIAEVFGLFPGSPFLG